MADTQLFYPEAERLMEELREIPVPSYGTNIWIRQIESIMRLNTKAHSDAISNGGTGSSEEIIPEILLTKDKLTVLIHELVSAEIYSLKIHPTIKSQIKDIKAPRAGLLSYYESVLANLVEICVSSPYAHTGDELLTTTYKGLIDLVDWCVHRVRLLVNDVIDEVAPLNQGSQNTNNKNQNTSENGDEEIKLDTSEADRTQLLILATSALSILRCICQVLAKLPLSVQSHVAREVDVPMLCCQLLIQKKQPWNREKVSAESGIRTYEYLQDGEWRSFRNPQERYVRITKIPGQIWVCLYSILSVEGGQLYALNRMRCQLLGQVAKQINQSLADQLPFLTQLRGALEGATLRYEQQAAATSSIPDFYGASTERKGELEALFTSMNDPAKGNSKVGLLNSGFVACEVAEIHERVERVIEEAGGGKKVSKEGTSNTISPYSSVGATIIGVLKSLNDRDNREDAIRIAELFGKQFEEAVGATAVHHCKGCGIEATLRCSRCKKEWYCGKKCQAKCWKEHKKVCKTENEKLDVKGCVKIESPNAQCLSSQPIQSQPIEYDLEVGIKSATAPEIVKQEEIDQTKPGEDKLDLDDVD